MNLISSLRTSITNLFCPNPDIRSYTDLKGIFEKYYRYPGVVPQEIGQGEDYPQMQPADMNSSIMPIVSDGRKGYALRLRLRAEGDRAEGEERRFVLALFEREPNQLIVRTLSSDANFRAINRNHAILEKLSDPSNPRIEPRESMISSPTAPFQGSAVRRDFLESVLQHKNRHCELI